MKAGKQPHQSKVKQLPECFLQWVISFVGHSFILGVKIHPPKLQKRPKEMFKCHLTQSLLQNYYLLHQWNGTRESDAMIWQQRVSSDVIFFKIQCAFTVVFSPDMCKHVSAISMATKEQVQICICIFTTSLFHREVTLELYSWVGWNSQYQSCSIDVTQAQDVFASRLTSEVDFKGNYFVRRLMEG